MNQDNGYDFPSSTINDDLRCTTDTSVPKPVTAGAGCEDWYFKEGTTVKTVEACSSYNALARL